MRWQSLQVLFTVTWKRSCFPAHLTCCCCCAHAVQCRIAAEHRTPSARVAHCAALSHKPHAPGSASRQRLGDSHQVPLGRIRPRPLTWAFFLNCVSDCRCMRMLLLEHERALGAHHAGELVPAAEARVLPLVAVPCDGVAALVLAPPGYQIHLHCRQHAWPAGVRPRHPACLRKTSCIASSIPSHDQPYQRACLPFLQLRASHNTQPFSAQRNRGLVSACKHSRRTASSVAPAVTIPSVSSCSLAPSDSSENFAH